MGTKSKQKRRPSDPQGGLVRRPSAARGDSPSDPASGAPVIKGSDRYETPREFFSYWNSLFVFELDACAEKKTAKCAKYYSLEDGQNSLALPWGTPGDTVWCNPPYSDVQPWINKAKFEQTRGVLTCMLLPGDISTKWYLSLRSQAVVKIPLSGRLGFLQNGLIMDGAKFGNIVVIFFPLLGAGARIQ